MQHFANCIYSLAQKRLIQAPFKLPIKAGFLLSLFSVRRHRHKLDWIFPSFLSGIAAVGR